MFKRIATLLEAIKFSHSIFALPFALLACFLASEGGPSVLKVVLIVVCMVLVRSVAMSYNRLADRKIDARNPRTAERALPAGKLSTGFMRGFMAICSVLAVLVCWLFDKRFGNVWPVLLIVPLLIYVCSYSHAKRFTWLSHYWLGSVLGSSVIATFVAIDPGKLSAGGVFLAVGVCLWTAGFDIIYSLLDVDYDRREGLFSIPARFGSVAALTVARVTHVLAFVSFALAGYTAGLTQFYVAGLVATGALLIIEHRMVRPGDLSRVNVAFFTMNGILSVFLSAMGIVDVLF